MTNDLYNVVAVNIETGARRFLAEGKTKADAEAISNFAVMKRGVEVEFYAVEQVGWPLCSDCPPPSYPTGKTRCLDCPYHIDAHGEGER